MPQPIELRSGIAEVEWRVELARTGVPSLCVGGARVHSVYDPQREAKFAAQKTLSDLEHSGSNLLILVGMGLGYLASELRRQFGGAIAIWDPFPELTRALPLQPGSWRNEVLVTSCLDELDALLTQALTRGERPHVISHPGYSELCRFELRLIAKLLRERAPRRSEQLSPSNAVVSRRALDALRRLPARANLLDLEECCREQTAILVAPGPSLGDSLDALATRRGGVLFAAVQAQRTLQEAGVRVNFAVAPDPLHSLPFLTGFTPDFDALLAECSVEPELLDRHRDRAYLFPLRSNQLYDVAWRRLGVEPFDEPFNTVSETMLVLAHHLGARRFVLAGVDLAGPEKGIFRARSAEGAELLTNSAYFHAARYLSYRCNRLARDGCEVWRVGDGLPIEGSQALEAASLPALLANAPGFGPPPVVSVPPDERKKRLSVVQSVLREAALSNAGGTSSSAATGVDSENRWSPYAELLCEERAAACEEALAAIDA